MCVVRRAAFVLICVCGAVLRSWPVMFPRARCCGVRHGAVVCGAM